MTSDRKEKKLTVRIPQELDKKLAIEAIRRETSKQALVISAIELILSGGSAAADVARAVKKAISKKPKEVTKK